MIAQLTRRFLGLGVSIFATLGFLAVPLGNKTGYQHAKAIVLSTEAQRFASELGQAAGQLKGYLLSELLDRSPAHPRYRPTGQAPRQPTPKSGTALQKGTH